MDGTLATAGTLSVALGLGHLLVGTRWILPALSVERIGGSVLGPPGTTLNVLRITWFIVTVFAVGMGAILLTLAFAEGADPRVVTLRWLGGTWVAATVMAAIVAPVRRSNLRAFLRLPVPLVWLVVGILCWSAA